MPQQVLNPVSPYGRSGSILLVNPTDRGNGRYVVPMVGVGSLSAREARDPRVIRGTTPVYADGSAASTATITTLTPSTGVHGTADALCTLTGTGYTTGTVVLFAGMEMPTTYVSATSVTIVAPLSMMPIGTANVTVRNPGQVQSAAKPFTIT